MSGNSAASLERRTVVRKERRIPTQGEVLVGLGDAVEPEAVLARGSVMNPEVEEVSIFSQLGVDPEMVGRYLLKSEGDEVKMNEVIAIRRSFFGRSTRVSRSPMDGTIEALSKISGRLLIRGLPIKVEVLAHIPGKVVQIIPGEGATLETEAALIKGVFGIGGETRGELALAVESPTEILTSKQLESAHKGKVVVGGSFVTLDALRSAVGLGVRGILTGGLDQRDLTDFLGREIGLGVTGDERVGLTIIMLGGFGVHPMTNDVFDLLSSREGDLACIDGTTQIRTNMLRPEVIIPI